MHNRKFEYKGWFPESDKDAPRKYRELAKEIDRIKSNMSMRKKAKEDRKKVIKMLGGQCVICGITDQRMLQIDHIKGDATKDRKNYPSASHYYRSILKMSERKRKENYQLLCANHNWVKRYEQSEHTTTSDKEELKKILQLKKMQKKIKHESWEKVMLPLIEQNLSSREIARRLGTTHQRVIKIKEVMSTNE